MSTLQKITISRDDRYHEAWPSVAIASNGDLVVSYSEADLHGGGPVSSAVVRISKDQGLTWSEPVVVETLTDRQNEGWLFCRSVIRLQDGSLLLACDWGPCNYTPPPGAMHQWGNEFGEVWLYRSFDNGKTWTERQKTGIHGAESLTLTQLRDGTIIIAGIQFVREGEYEYQVIWRSTDNGHTWTGPITVLRDPESIYCEGQPVELPGGELVMYIRENLMKTGTGTKAISYDGGLTWEGPFSAGKWPIVGRVSAGMLSTGEILVMHRVGGFALQYYFGYFVESVESALSKTPYKNRLNIKTPSDFRWGIIDNDLSAFPDYGYGGWVELPSKDIFAVNYIVDNAPENRPQIRGYLISRNELLNPNHNITIDFELPDYKRGILAGQNGWVQQSPNFWHIGDIFTGNQYVDNFVLVDNSGKHSCSGKASLTGSRNKGGKGPQVVRRDIGPFDLMEEDVEISFIHSGKQYWGIFQVLDAGGSVIVEIHSDFIYDCLYAKYNRSRISKSNINTGNGWWETKLAFTKDETKIFTRDVNSETFGKPWFVNRNFSGGCYSIKNDINKDLIGVSNLNDIVAAIAIALGEDGNMYIDKITVTSSKI